MLAGAKDPVRVRGHRAELCSIVVIYTDLFTERAYQNWDFGVGLVSTDDSVLMLFEHEQERREGTIFIYYFYYTTLITSYL